MFLGIGTYYLLLYALILTIISVNTARSPVSSETALDINTNITFIPAYCPLCKYISRVLDHAWLGTELQNKSHSFINTYLSKKERGHFILPLKLKAILEFIILTVD